MRKWLSVDLTAVVSSLIPQLKNIYAEVNHV